jgi:hypothetical protein
LRLQKHLGDRVGGARGERGIARDEFDLQHPRLGHGKNSKAREELIDDSLVGAALAPAPVGNAEFRAHGKIELFDRLARQVRGGDRFRLALDGLRIDRRRRIES